jgi:hypothetical protein
MNHKTPFILMLKVLAIATLLSACSVVPTSLPTTNLVTCPPPRGLALSADRVLRYYTCLGTLPASDVASEYHAVSLSFSETGSNSDRLKLAILLSLPDTEFHSTAAALNLVKNMPAGPEPVPSTLPDLALLLSVLLEQQQHADDSISELKKELSDEKVHSDFLQKKIDAVKDLEINLIHRDQP